MVKRVIIGAISLVLFLFVGYGYKLVYSSNVEINQQEDPYLYIHENSKLQDVIDQLDAKKALKNESSFRWLAKVMKYNDEKVIGGKYKLESGMSNRSLIVKLRAGMQSPVDITFNNVRTIPELAGAMSANIEIDSQSLQNFLYSTENLRRLGLDSSTLMTAFIPDTYKDKWNVKPEKLINRLYEERNKFWEKKDRTNKLKSLNLTKEEVYTLASIVEKESNLKEERPRLAGVYLNRLKQGMKLQADPTVVFASGDFGLRRVLFSHLNIDSPYNTYMYLGLPPGPICMPSINSIDAVLNAEENQYLYFCAKQGYQGGHQFAKTLVEHNRNASNYQQWLSSEGIK